jgi:hypothetical protein
MLARRCGEEAQARVEARGGIRRRWRLGSTAGCDVLTGAQVSQMSRWLLYENIGSPCICARDDREEDGVHHWRRSCGVCRRKKGVYVRHGV